MITLSKTFFLDAILVISLLFVYSEKEKEMLKFRVQTERSLKNISLLCTKEEKLIFCQITKITYQLYFDVFRFDE